MKAWVVEQYGEPKDALVSADKPLPEPGPGELRVEVRAAAFGLPDVLMCRNSYLFSPPLPFTPGQEIAGIVTATGEGSNTPVGSHIMAITAFYNGHGGLAESAIVLDAAAFEIPSTMSDEEAAAFAIPFHTAYIGLVSRAKLNAGETVLVHGAAGGTGCAAIQLASALGAKVIACASSDAKLEQCKHWGADVLINHAKENVAEAVMNCTDGQGANIIYDPVGGETFASSVNYTANEGRLLAIGFASGEWGQAATEAAVLRNCSVMGVYVGAYDQATMKKVHQQLLNLYADGKIKPVLDAVVDFDDIPVALQRLADREVQGKVVAKW